MMNIVFLGSPGAGKGTQAARLATEKNFAHISTGDIFRAELKNNTPLGLKAKEYMDKGELVPDDLVVDMVNKKINELSNFDGCLLDGFPRNISQAKAMEGKIDVEVAIYLNVDKDDVIARLSSRRTCKECGHIQGLVDTCSKCNAPTYQREDDTKAVIEKRLDVYEEQTMPLINYYQDKNILHKLDGARPVETVYADILSHLEK